MKPWISFTLLFVSIFMCILSHHPLVSAQESASDATTEPSRSIDILEAEARTARELSYAAAQLQKDLSSCQTRVQSIQKGFQNLYSTHLLNVDGLRKCREGMLGAQEMEDLAAKLAELNGKVDPDLLLAAQKSEDDNRRRLRDEEIVSKHKELILSLESQVQQLRLRERAWERTISELVARRDLLERREGAWER